MEKTVEELIQDLKSDDEFDLEQAFTELDMRKDEAVEPLIEALTKKNQNKDIKKGSAKVLGMFKNTKAIPALIDTLYDGNKLVRRESSTALSRMGEDAVDPLIAVLNDDDWKVRGAAVWALGGIESDSEKAVDEIAKLLEDESGFVKAGAKLALNKIGTDKAKEYLK
ncbi:MAG: HEAT repeat domain-containing protein [Methanobacteriaceae archaeon]